MNKRKLLTLAMTLCMVAILAIGGTLAYFTDTDDASNTFELGGVKIDLIEKTYENGAWKEIENPEGTATLGQLDPIVDDWAEVTAAGYAYNKSVFTYNKEDEAYIRNYVAIENIGNPEGYDEDIYKIWYNEVGLADAEGNWRHGAQIKDGSENIATFENVNIDGTLFDIYVFDTLNNAPVATGESFMTLTTVILDSWVTNDMIELLGDQFEIYTWSEAIQTTGLTHAEAMTALIGDDVTLNAHAVRMLTEVMGE